MQKNVDINLFFLGSTDSKSSSFYKETDEKIEFWSNILFKALVKLTVPVILMPNFIISFFNYFTTDLNDMAFSLPFPIW